MSIVQSFNSLQIVKKLDSIAYNLSGISSIENLVLKTEEIIEEIIDVEYNGLYLFDPVYKQLRLLFAKHFTEEERLEAERTAMDRHPGKVFKSGKKIHISDVEKDSQKLSSSSKRSFTIRSRLYLPVMSRDKCVGAFGLASSKTNAFSELHIALLSFVCNMAGVVYSNLMFEKENQLALKQIKENEESLFRINENLTTTISSIDELIIVLNHVNIIIETFESNNFVSNFLETSECIFKHFNSLKLDSETITQLTNTIKKSKFDYKVYKSVFQIKGKGKTYWFQANIKARKDKYGNFDGSIIVFRDITEQEELQQKVIRNQMILSNFMNSIDEVFIVTDKSLRIIEINKFSEKFFNTTRDHLIGKNISEISPEALTSGRYSNYINVINQNTSFEVEETIANTKFGQIHVAIKAFSIGIGMGLIIRDISETHKAKHQLILTTSRLSTLIKNLNSGVLLEDENQKIILSNEKFCEFFCRNNKKTFSYEKPNCSQCVWKSSKLFKDAHQFEERIIDLISKKEICVNEELETSDGRFYERDFIPIYKNNEYLGHLWQYRDITQRKRNNTDLQQAKIDADLANQAKSRFLAIMSHEIRTPLHAIGGMAKLIEETRLTLEQKKYLDAIISSNDNLLAIINDILDFSKIEAGKLELEITNFSIRDVIKNIYNSHKIKSEEKNLHFAFQIDPIITDYHMGDPVRLTQILINLTNNSIKFTKHGFVEISAELIDNSENSQTIIFSVSDSGKGIKKEAINDIFNRFKQEDESITRKFGGTGLGLAISKELVELLGGSIHVESTPYVKTRFYFTLKMNIGQQPCIEKSKLTDEEPTDLKNLKILIAEDHQVNQFFIISVLKKWNIEPDVVTNGKEAIEKLKSNKYDLILMDNQMPEMDGIEATLIIRKNLKLNIPIIALTASAIKEVIDSCLQSGMQDYLTKPFKPKELYQKIIQLIDISKFNKKQSDSVVKKIDMELNSSQSLDLKPLKEMFQNDAEQINRLLQLFVSQTTEQLENLKVAFNKKDYKTIGMVAHKVKPSLDLIRAKHLVEPVRKIEKLNSSNLNENIEVSDKLISWFIDELQNIIDMVRKHNQ